MEDYKMRMVEEYAQVRGRADRLDNLLRAWERGTLSFTPSCPRDLLECQLHAMNEYCRILEERAEIEGVPLTAGREEA